MTSLDPTTRKQLLRRRIRNWLLVSSLAIAVAVLLFGYPLLLGASTARFGLRATAFGLLAWVVASLALAWRRPQRAFEWFALALPSLLLAALAFDSPLLLRWVPAVVHLTLAVSCLASLRDGGSLIATGLGYLVPEAPDFVRPYCRKVTALWGVLFALSALTIAVLAGDEDAWRLYLSWGFSGLVLAISLVEFCVRKTWFRYYFFGGPIDRVWSRLFPAEGTERGRRSLAAIERYRASRTGSNF